MSAIPEEQSMVPQKEQAFTSRETIEDIVQLDTIALLKKEPFYAYLLVKMHKKIDRSVPVAGVAVINGDIHLFINPEGYMRYTRGERIAILKHEVLHVILIHYLRRRDRDPSLFNIAADVAINQMVNSDLYKLPVDALFPHHFNLEENLNAEQYYKILWQRNEQIKIPPDLMQSLGKTLSQCSNCQGSGQEPQDGNSGSGDSEGDGENEGEGQGQGQGDSPDGNQEGHGNGQGQGQGGTPCSCCGGSGQKQPGEGQGDGSEMRAPAFADMHPTWDRSTDVSEDVAESIVRSLVQEAYDKSIGKVPGEISALINDILSSKINWRAIFRNFVAKQRHTTKKNTWKRPNRRLDRQVMGYKKNKKLHVFVFIDTSGSVGGTELEMFNGELQKMYDAGTEITVIECDMVIQNVYKYKKHVQPTFKGRGGTDFRPPFKYVLEKNERPDAIIYLTDGYGHAPATCPFPVLWVLTPDSRRPMSEAGGDVTYGGQIVLQD